MDILNLISLVFPVILRCGEFYDNVAKYVYLASGYDKSDINRKSFKYEGFERVDYIIPEIKPREIVVIEEAINITYASLSMPHVSPASFPPTS